ncbi:MAG: MEDS domain-containing protein [Acidobacteriales bacterium]|nr:MEDS domain-containing protein [Terriglobales bacterium]
MSMRCENVRREISNYIDGVIGAAQRQNMDDHFKSCKHCTAVLEGMRNVISLAGDSRAHKVPAGFSNRLFSKLSPHATAERSPSPTDEIPIGITGDSVALGSHLIYFWESQAEFERGVRFVESGLQRHEHCILFGHDEALDRASQVLRSSGFSPEQLVRNRELTVLRRHASAEITLSDIEAVVEAAVRAGSPAVRFLGNLGMGRSPLPAGEDDVIQLEERVTAVISRFPCVVVCMYDVRTLPGRLIVKGGLQTHRLAVCDEGLRENPYYIPELHSAHRIHHVQ